MASQKQKMGFPPIYNADSRILILGSFPSVKSREIAFYYGNKQNRFWRTVCGFFGEEIPETTQGKEAFLIRRNIALWDMVIACEVDGSADSSIKNVKISDLSPIFHTAKIEKILLNGTLAFDLFVSQYCDCGIPYVKMPSTSPANPRFQEEQWRKELDDVYRIY